MTKTSMQAAVLCKPFDRTSSLFFFFYSKAEFCQVTGLPNSVFIPVTVPIEQVEQGQRVMFGCSRRGHVMRGEKLWLCFVLRLRILLHITLLLMPGFEMPK